MYVDLNSVVSIDRSLRPIRSTNGIFFSPDFSQQNVWVHLAGETRTILCLSALSLLEMWGLFFQLFLPIC
jgi:hypothetical protein